MMAISFPVIELILHTPLARQRTSKYFRLTGNLFSGVSPYTSAEAIIGDVKMMRLISVRRITTSCHRWQHRC